MLSWIPAPTLCSEPDFLSPKVILVAYLNDLDVDANVVARTMHTALEWRAARRLRVRRTSQAKAQPKNEKERFYSAETLDAIARRIGLAPGMGNTMCQKFTFETNSTAT
jgi:hypothetical protein